MATKQRALTCNSFPTALDPSSRHSVNVVVFAVDFQQRLHAILVAGVVWFISQWTFRSRLAFAGRQSCKAVIRVTIAVVAIQRFKKYLVIVVRHNEVYFLKFSPFPTASSDRCVFFCQASAEHFLLLGHPRCASGLCDGTSSRSTPRGLGHLLHTKSPLRWWQHRRQREGRSVAETRCCSDRCCR